MIVEGMWSAFPSFSERERGVRGKGGAGVLFPKRFIFSEQPHSIKFLPTCRVTSAGFEKNGAKYLPLCCRPSSGVSDLTKIVRERECGRKEKKKGNPHRPHQSTN